MTAPASLEVSVMKIASGLRDDTPSYVNLNRAAGRIDHLGRLLHGLDCVRHREIAACFMAAIGELQASTELPEPTRTSMVARAVSQLEAACVHLGEGTTALSCREDA
jgi:hypothetical protein